MGGERPLRIVYFLEDYAHQQFIPPLVERLADELGIAHSRVLPLPDMTSGYARGSRILPYFQRFLRDANRRIKADLLVVCTDDDCAGYAAKRQQFQDELAKAPIPQPILYAIPNPYIEYWYLADKAALCKVLEVSSLALSVPKGKCDRTIYKTLLRKTIEDTGIETNQGGTEYGEDIVAALNLHQSLKHHPARQFIEDARQALRQFVPKL